MVEDPLDEVDRHLLTLLQEDARYTAVELAERIGVSDNTVHNRLADLEAAGIVTGYTARIPPTEVGLDFYFMFLCTARISDRAAVAKNALEMTEVTEVTELMTGQRNLHIKAVGSEHDDITRIAQQLDDLELEVNDEFLIRAEHEQALDFNAVG
jgi:DNA-binding Lrp family transcriptional regulator